MKAIGIVGSYRKRGTIDTAVEAALMGAAEAGFETEQIFLADKDIQFCRNCRSCTQSKGREPGECVIDDDMKGIIEACRGADVLVIGCPVNHGMVTAVTKAFFERLTPMAYWPWGQMVPKVRMSRRDPRPRAVLVTSSGSPAFIGRHLFNSMKTLRDIAGMFDARVTSELYFGSAGRKADSTLSERNRRKAKKAGAFAAWHRGLNPTWPIDAARARLLPGAR